jgi:serine/threonine protein kinase
MLGKTISHYRVIGKLGGGGMGIVYEAQDETLGRHVALKFLPPELSSDASALERFQREARAASALNHPNICTIHEIGQQDGQYFIVMERLEGMTVRERILGKPLRTDQLLELAVDIAGALDAAHTKGIIHRDIKPANMLLDGNGRVTVLDLGLARLEEPEQEGDGEEGGRLTMPGTFLGTFDYVAPEQAVDAHDVDGRCDIYSLGCTLYYLLRGRPPYRRENAPQTLLAHCQDPIPKLREEFPGVPERLAALFQRMLAKLPSGRLGTMTEVVAELEVCQRELTGGVTPPVTTGRPAQDSRSDGVTPSAHRVDPPAADSIPRPAAFAPLVPPVPAPPSMAADSHSEDTSASIGITATETDPAGGRGQSRLWLAFARAPFTAAWSAAVRAKDWLRQH